MKELTAQRAVKAGLKITAVMRRYGITSVEIRKSGWIFMSIAEPREPDCIVKKENDRYYIVEKSDGKSMQYVDKKTING